VSAPQQIVEVDVITMKRPDDASGLEELFRNGREPSDVVAIVGKTDGTGLGKDPAREATDLAVKRVLSARLGIPVDAVHDRVCIVLSGGSPGLITPHIAVFSRRLVAAHTEAASDRLVLGLTHSEPIAPHEVGRLAQVRKVEEAVRKAVKDAGTDAASVHAVLVKAPALTEQGIREANAAGHDTVTRDLSIGPEGALCYSNDASALGVAVALGEVARGDVTSEAIRADFSLFSNVAITSSGGEKTRAEVMVIANGPSGAGPLRSGHSPMHDVLDVDALGRAMTDAGLTDEARTQGAGLTYLLMKMIVPGDRIVLGEPITWHDDPAAYHVAKAMGGYAMAFATGSTRGFVSGGEQNSHQGPPGGNPVAAIVRLAGGASDTVLRRD
jgi:cyanuric acid amidohydrolase